MRIVALVLSASLAAVAQAQMTFPSRPVTLVLPSAPGDPTDLIARVLQSKVSERLGGDRFQRRRQGAARRPHAAARPLGALDQSDRAEGSALRHLPRLRAGDAARALR